MTGVPQLEEHAQRSRQRRDCGGQSIPAFRVEHKLLGRSDIGAQLGVLGCDWYVRAAM